METTSWFIILIIFLCISALTKPLLNLLFPSKMATTSNLPSEPPTIPIIGMLQWLAKPMSDHEPIIRNLHAKYGPIMRLPDTIYITTHFLAHQALILNATTVADRPRSLPTHKIINSNQHTINFGLYGPIWLTLCHNLTSEILQPSHVKSYSGIHKRALEMLVGCLKSQSESRVPVCVVDHFHPAIFCISALICFSDHLQEELIKEIDQVESNLIWSLGRFNLLNFCPRIANVLFRKHWEELLQLHIHEQDLYCTLIEEREKMMNKQKGVISYVDTLLEVQLPDEKRKLEKGKVVSICSEFLIGMTDNTAITLNWIMAYLTKYPHIQEKLFAEISESMRCLGEEFVKEEDLGKMSYLRAVVLEALRIRPALHFLLPHAATEDVVLGGYLVPKNTNLNFMVSDLGLDPKVWEDPMAFKLEGFLSRDDVNGIKVFDIRSHGKEIRMMPFGAGRRMCPGHGLAMLHLEYFVANWFGPSSGLLWMGLVWTYQRRGKSL